MKILVIGSGSIGQRHIKNLKSLRIKDIQVFDSDKKLLKLVEKKFNIKVQNKLNFEINSGQKYQNVQFVDLTIKT